MAKRPTSITVICWIIIVFGVIGALGMIAVVAVPEAQVEMAKSPIPVPVQLAMSFVGLAITTVCGIFMLGGQNWARLLYVGWNIFGLIFGVINTANPIATIAAMIPGLIFFGVIVFFLFRPNANSFFKGRIAGTQSSEF